MTRYSGDAGAFFGQEDQAAADARANSLIVGGVGGPALSFASKYGGPTPTPGNNNQPATAPGSGWIS